MFDVDNASVDDLEVVWASYNQMKYEWLMSTEFETKITWTALRTIKLFWVAFWMFEDVDTAIVDDFKVFWASYVIKWNMN